MHRLECTRACDFAHTSCTYIYICHVLIYIYICIDAKSGYVNGYACVFVHTRAIACGR